jgi:hypothetical protein
MIYGRNVVDSVELIKEVFMSCKTPIAVKKPLREVEDVTEEEIAALEKQYYMKMLPPDKGWYHDGRIYCNEDQEYSSCHPALLKLMGIFVEEENIKIGEYNREVQKKLDAEAKSYN